MRASQGGYYSMQCLCGFQCTDKPQSKWADDDYKREAQHQQFHQMQQALSYPSITETKENAVNKG